MGNPIGYMAVICPEMNFWQGFFINDGEDIRRGAEKLREMASALATLNAIPEKAVYLGGIAESATSGNTGTVAATALLLSETESNFFYVVANQTEDGYYSTVHPLRVISADEARKAIEGLPEVMAIKRRLLARLGIREGQGRKSSFR